MNRRTRPLLLAAAVAALAPAATALAAPRAAAAQHVTLVVKSDTEHAKKGPDGKWHDAFLPGNFTVKAGSAVVVTVKNYDTAMHTFTAKGLGLAVKIAAGSAGKAATTTFTLRAPRTGSFTWICMMNCDPYAMAHNGYMRGRITAVA